MCAWWREDPNRKHNERGPRIPCGATLMTRHPRTSLADVPF